MTKKYGPIIAHQGEDKCPCDPDAKGRRWYENGEIYYGRMINAKWSRVVAYQLEPKRETVVSEQWVGFDVGRAFITTGSFHGGVKVHVTTNLVDGIPVSGSWEAV